MGMDIDSKRKLLRTIKAKEAAKKDRSIEDFEGSVVQKAVLQSKAKIRICVGANRSGKSHVGGIDTCVRVTGIVPTSLKGQVPEERLRQGAYWVSSLDFPSSRDITQVKVDQFLPKRMRHSFNKEDKKHILLNGSEIGFKSCDSGRKKYQGTSRVGIWMDEEHPEDVYDEIYMRTTDCAGYILFTFTPVEGLTWSYQKLYQKASVTYFSRNKHGLKEEVGVVHTPEEIERIKDRELCVRKNTSESADPDVEVFQMSIYDNKWLPNAEIQRAERKYAADPAQYNARILGRFTKITGQNVFPVEVLMRGQANCPTQFLRGDIISGKFVETKRGNLTVFKQKKPAGKGYYIIGADIAEGLEHGDASCAQVIDHETCEQVAIWHGRVSPEKMARILIDLGRYYNYAYLAPERNFHGFGVVNRIRDQKYPRLFCDYTHSLKQNQESGEKKYGWETNVKTKTLMVQALAEFLTESHIKINDVNTYEELITFVYDKDGKMGALRGCFDDRAIALMIALMVYKKRRPVRQRYGTAPKQPTNKITGY